MPQPLTQKRIDFTTANLGGLKDADDAASMVAFPRAAWRDCRVGGAGARFWQMDGMVVMTQKAPERIWTASTDGKCHVGFDTPSMNYTNEYVRADLAQAPAPVRVKDFTVEVVRGNSGNLALYFNDYRVAGGKPWGGGTTLYEFKVKADNAKSSGILAALEAPDAAPTSLQKVQTTPDAGVLAELVEALREISALDDNAECCGQGVCGGYSPPECCGQPLYGLDRAKNITRAVLAKWDAK